VATSHLASTYLYCTMTTSPVMPPPPLGSWRAGAGGGGPFKPAILGYGLSIFWVAVSQPLPNASHGASNMGVVFLFADV